MEVAQVLDRVVAKFIGTKHERDIKRMQPVVAAINAKEAELRGSRDGGPGGGDGVSDEQLKERFLALRTQVQERLKDADPAEPAYKESLRQALEPVVVPAFALVREAGGFVTDLDGRDVSPASAGILAANEAIHRELLRVLGETRKT